MMVERSIFGRWSWRSVFHIAIVALGVVLAKNGIGMMHDDTWMWVGGFIVGALGFMVIDIGYWVGGYRRRDEDQQ